MGEGNGATLDKIKGVGCGAKAFSRGSISVRNALFSRHCLNFSGNRRPSNLSGFLPPPALGLAPPVPAPGERRLSAYLPQRRASYFVPLPSRESSKDSGGKEAINAGSRRGSFLLAPDPSVFTSGKWSPGTWALFDRDCGVVDAFFCI